MADVFEDRSELEPERLKLWELIARTPWLDWLLLTKRPENAARMAPASWSSGWPSNVWAMTTAEDQGRADERIPILLTLPAVVRGVSYEPALGPVDFRFPGVLKRSKPGDFDSWSAARQKEYIGASARAEYIARGETVDWVIVGGESGPGARPFEIEWARSVVEQCRQAGVAVFVTQLGAHVITSGMSGPGQHWPSGGTLLIDTGRGNFRKPLLDHRKGGNWFEWPEDLRVREFPEVAHG
jgi:protein gp37